MMYNSFVLKTETKIVILTSYHLFRFGLQYTQCSEEDAGLWISITQVINWTNFIMFRFTRQTKQ